MVNPDESNSCEWCVQTVTRMSLLTRKSASIFVCWCMGSLFHVFVYRICPTSSFHYLHQTGMATWLPSIWVVSYVGCLSGVRLYVMHWWRVAMFALLVILCWARRCINRLRSWSYDSTPSSFRGKGDAAGKGGCGKRMGGRLKQLMSRSSGTFLTIVKL